MLADPIHPPTQSGALLPASLSAHRGLLILFTGAGQGKSSAAIGMAHRAATNGQRVAFLEFRTNPDHTYVIRDQLATNPLIDYFECCADCVWSSKTRTDDTAMVAQALRFVRQILTDTSYSMVVLDDIHPLLHQTYLRLDPLLLAIRQRAPHQNLILTGSNAPIELVDQADMASELRQLAPHPHHNSSLPQAFRRRP